MGREEIAERVQMYKQYVLRWNNGWVWKGIKCEDDFSDNLYPRVDSNHHCLDPKSRVSCQRASLDAFTAHYRCHLAIPYEW